MTTPSATFDQFLVQLSEFLAAEIVANHHPEALDLYCDGESVSNAAEAIAAVVQLSAPDTGVI